MCQAVHFIHGVTAEEASSKEKLEKRKLQEVKASESLAESVNESHILVSF